MYNWTDLFTSKSRDASFLIAAIGEKFRVISLIITFVINTVLKSITSWGKDSDVVLADSI